MERLAAEEYEKERVRGSRTRPDLNLSFEPSEAWPSSPRSSTPSSFASQEDAEAEVEAVTPVALSETGTIHVVHVGLTKPGNDSIFRVITTCRWA